MNEFSEWFASSLMRNSLTLIVAALIVATCVKWMRLRSPAGEQWAWLLVLVQGVMFVWLTVPLPSGWAPDPPQLPKLLQPQPVPAEIDVPEKPAPKGVPLRLEMPQRGPFDRSDRQMEVIVEAEPETDRATVVAPPPAPLMTFRERLPSWQVVLCAVWLAGLSVVVAIGLARYVAFVRKLRLARPAPALWADEWQRQRDAAAVPTAIPLLVADNLGPALCRLPSGYRLVVPEETWTKLSSEERVAVYRHELEHLRRGDLWWTLLARLLACVHWFNPFAWWAARRYEAQSEFACDTAAAAGDPAGFSQLLVQLASGRSRRVVGVQSVAAGRVYERVERLVTRTGSQGGWRSAVPVVVALFAVTMLSVRIEAVEPAAADTRNDVAASNRADSPADAVDDRRSAAARGGEQATSSENAEPVSPPQDVTADELAGVVVDAEGKPVADVLIDVWHWHPGNETRTDEHGVFRIGGLDPNERVEVLISREGYTPQHFPQRQVGARGWVVVLSDKTYLEGAITGADGQPAVGAEIRAAFGPVQGDGVQISEVVTIGRAGLDGKYRLYLKPETYDIQISAPEQGVQRLSDVVLTEGQSKMLSVELERGVRFEARVVDSETGEPVEGFILWQWRSPKLFGRSDAAGRIVFDGLVPGTIEFSCGGGEANQHGETTYYRHGPFGRWWSEQALNDFQRKSIDDPQTGWQRNFDDLAFGLSDDMSPVEIVVERGVRVTGRVTDPDGNPVHDATVAPARTGSGNSLTGDTRYSVKTDANGNYEVVLPASNDARYNLVVHDGDYQQWRNWANGIGPVMQTEPGQEIEGFDLQLTRPAVVRGRVTVGGQPAVGRDVRTHAFDKTENRYYDPTTTTDADGNFELKFVRPGKHYLQVEPFWLSAEDASQGTRIIEVEPRQVLEGQDLAAAPVRRQPSRSMAALRFQARVVDSDGQPVAGASVGLGLFGGTPHYMEALQKHFAALRKTEAPPTPVTGADGLFDLTTQTLVQIGQNIAWVYAVDAEGGRAGTTLLDLNDYATADPAGDPQIVDVPIETISPTRIQLNAESVEKLNLGPQDLAMMLTITKDGLPLQHVLAQSGAIELLLPEGAYATTASDWFAERVQSTFTIESAASPRAVDIDLQLSRLGRLIGEPAPEFAQLRPPEIGANPTLAGLEGQVVVLDFWGHWCGPCIGSMPKLMQLYDEFQDQRVKFVAVHDASVESWSELAPILERIQAEHWEGRAIPFPVVLDGGGEIQIPGSDLKVNGATTALYGIKAWPTTLVIDRTGKLVGPVNIHDLDQARTKLLSLLEDR